MDTVTVAQLKARLSHYLREVRAGQSFTVVSHGVPVAVLGPHEAWPRRRLKVIEPTEDPSTWGQIDLPPLGQTIDVVALIREDRDDRDNRLDALTRGDSAGDAPGHSECDE
jgi:prevent-host-death family protein